MSSDLAADWMRRYLEAWRTNDPEQISALFTSDAVYFTAPYARPWRGAAAIAKSWLARKDTPGSWEFDWTLVATDGDVAVVRGTTRYLDPPAVYFNLWVLRLDDDGRCREFTEWWMAKPS